ncbi:hypothetical protein AURDEDRAFT_148954, partial [Auricularia subglabra TFB-10046 SS5]
MYVIILIEILGAVIPDEAYLFSQEELDFFCQFDKLSYQAKYLLLRLSLRKEGKWHSLSGLDNSYHADLGPLLPGAMEELSGKQPTPPEEPKPRARKMPVSEVIDLTLDDDEPPLPAANPSRHVPNTLVASCSRAATSTGAAPDRPTPPLFALGEQSADLSDLLQCLNKDQLKDIANQLKLDKVNKKSREELIASLLAYAKSQSALTHERGPLKQLTLNFFQGKKTSQSDLLRSRIMKILGKCSSAFVSRHAIKLESHVLIFLRRLQIVFFRATKYAADLFLPSILAKAKRRNYAKYEYKRTDRVFPSRDRFLGYVNALMIESEIDDLLEGFGFTYQPKSKAAKEHAKSISTTPRQDAAERAKKLAADAWKEWDELVTAAEDSGVEDEPFLARFHPGHVYTRILHTSCKALAILKDYKSEITALKYLLGQNVWRNSKRGAWYERLAVIYTQYAKDPAILDEEDSKKFTEEERPHLHLAREIVLKGLEDPDTHLVWRITLENRIFKLENRLGIPKEERYKAARRLKNPPKVFFQGERVTPRADSPKGTLPFAPKAASAVEEEPWKGKSIWVGENHEHVSVEELAIQWYADKGFKAVHSEGRVVTSIFALTFWDILFSSVPGAFETKFQNAPLDIFHDTFFQSRRDAIEQRLEELEAGRGREILEAVDDRERPRQTVCIGMRWDKFSKEDLGDIVDCLGGKALSIICR